MKRTFKLYFKINKPCEFWSQSLKMGSLKSTQNSQCHKLSKVWTLWVWSFKIQSTISNSKGAIIQNSKRGLTQIRNKASLKLETRIKDANSKHSESPKLELSIAKIRVQIRESMNT